MLIFVPILTLILTFAPTIAFIIVLTPMPLTEGELKFPKDPIVVLGQGEEEGELRKRPCIS